MRLCRFVHFSSFGASSYREGKRIWRHFFWRHDIIIFCVGVFNIPTKQFNKAFYNPTRQSWRCSSLLLWSGFHLLLLLGRDGRGRRRVAEGRGQPGGPRLDDQRPLVEILVVQEVLRVQDVAQHLVDALDLVGCLLELTDFANDVGDLEKKRLKRESKIGRNICQQRVSFAMKMDPAAPSKNMKFLSFNRPTFWRLKLSGPISEKRSAGPVNAFFMWWLRDYDGYQHCGGLVGTLDQTQIFMASTKLNLTLKLGNVAILFSIYIPRKSWMLLGT